MDRTLPLPEPDQPSCATSTRGTRAERVPAARAEGRGAEESRTGEPGAGETGSVRLEALPGVYRLWRPAQQTLPLVLASPHSGRLYPESFLAEARLDAHTLRRSEDCFVDEIFAEAAELGTPLLAAEFPRAYVDPNREPYELDPGMFEGPVPPYVNSRSARVAAGLGTIARIVATGEEIYRRKLRFGEALERVERCYRPYHAALQSLVAETRERFGYCILLDCHSMPSIDLPPEAAAGGRLDMILGDCHGSACAPALTEQAESTLTMLGYLVGRNAPYAGGYTTRHYGRPERGVHALQIELNRSLYMDEHRLRRRPYLATLAQHMRRLTAALAHVPAERLHRGRR